MGEFPCRRNANDYRRQNSNVFYPWMSILAHINEFHSLLYETVEYRAAGFSARSLSWFWVGEEFGDLRNQTSGICICIWVMKNDHLTNKTFIIKKSCHAGWQGHFKTNSNFNVILSLRKRFTITKWYKSGVFSPFVYFCIVLNS